MPRIFKRGFRRIRFIRSALASVLSAFYFKQFSCKLNDERLLFYILKNDGYSFDAKMKIL